MRFVSLKVLEAIFGVGWGVVVSMYAYSLVVSGFENEYGLLAFLMSFSAILGIVVSVALKGRIELLMPLTAILLSTATLCLLSDNALFVPILLGFAAGFHGVSSLYAISRLRGDFRKYSATYASGLFGFSVGSLLVVFGVYEELLWLLIASVNISGMLYTRFYSKCEIEAFEAKYPEFSSYGIAFTLLRRCHRNVRQQCGFLHAPEIQRL